VVDECFDGDVILMNHLSARPAGQCSLLLVGDVDQLPSVGPGMVLANLIDSAVVPVVRLTEVFARRAQPHRHQRQPHQRRSVAETDAKEGDFYFVNARNRAYCPNADRHGENPDPGRNSGSIRSGTSRSLCPMNRGSLGIRELNGRPSRQRFLNPPRDGERGGEVRLDFSRP